MKINNRINRRDALKAIALVACSRPLMALPTATNKVIVAGAGISGLCCAYDLVKKGFEVVILEAAGRSGGHIFTFRDGLDDGLYADGGAEHFYRPGYDQLWTYIDEMQLPVIAYPRRRNLLTRIGGRLYTKEELSAPSMLREQGYNQREIEYLRKNSIYDLPGLYYTEYIDKFTDEYMPFDTKLAGLDSMTLNELLRSKGASPAATASLGGSAWPRSNQSALQAVWHAALRRKRHMAWVQLNLFRIRGGNQRLTDALAARLGHRLRLACPVTAIEHSPGGVRVQYKSAGTTMFEEADHLVTCMPLSKLRRIPVTPQWPEPKQYVIENMPHDSYSRIIFQTRTRFWQKDGISPNMDLRDPSLEEVWPMAEEVPTRRGILIGASPMGSPEKALVTYRQAYTGKSADIDKSYAVNWIDDPWASTCLPAPLPPGVLSKYWPELIQPYGRIHFAGVYADDYPFGMEAGVRSAQRVVREIENA